MPGSTMRLKGRLTRVCGVLQYRDRSSGRVTNEYMLDGTTRGGQYLEEEAGEWSLVQPLTGRAPVAGAGGRFVRLHNREFQREGRTVITLVAAAGEFDELPEIGERLEYECYEDDTHGLCRESVSGEQPAWYHYEWLDASPVSGGEISGLTPGGVGTGLGIPSLSVIFILLAVLVHTLFAWVSQDRQVLASSERTVADAASWTTETFRVDGRTSNVLVRITSNVDNEWLGMRLTLVNVETGLRYAREEEVAYYHGYEGGEYWREGDSRQDVYFGSIPAGEYELEVDVEADRPAIRYRFSVHRDVTRQLYLVLVLAVLAVPAVIIVLRRLER